MRTILGRRRRSRHPGDSRPDPDLREVPGVQAAVGRGRPAGARRASASTPSCSTSRCRAWTASRCSHRLRAARPRRAGHRHLGARQHRDGGRGGRAGRLRLPGEAARPLPPAGHARELPRPPGGAVRERRSCRRRSRSPRAARRREPRACSEVREFIDKVAPTRRDGADHRRERHRQGAGRRARIHERQPRAASARSSRSTAPRSRASCSRASCSATRRARSPAPTRQRIGKFELADGGTLFLDEIGDMSAGGAGQGAARAAGEPLRARRRHRDASGSTCASSPRRTATWSAIAAGPASARTSSTGSTSSPIHLPPLRERGGDVAAAARVLPGRRLPPR